MKSGCRKHMLAYLLSILMVCSGILFPVSTSTEAAKGEQRGGLYYGIAYYSEEREASQSSLNSRPGSSIQIALPSGKEYFGSQLDSDAKFIYDVFRDQLTKTYDGKSEIHVTVPKGLINGNKVNYCFQYAIDAFRADYPEVFWIDFSKMTLQYWCSRDDNSVEEAIFAKNSRYADYYVEKAADSFVLNGKPVYYFGGEQPFYDASSTKQAIQRVENRVNACLKTVENCSSDYEKIKGIHDWLAANISYDYNHFDQSLYAALVQGSAVCAGYVSAFDYIAKKAGIETIQVSGVGHSTSTQSENHAWNLVKVDGTWYELDLTWNDPKNGTEPYRDFFLVGTETKASVLKGNLTFAASHEMHSYFTSAAYSFAFPAISKTAYVYSEKTQEPAVSQSPGPVASEPVSSVQPSKVKKGDVNMDNAVDLRDAQLALKSALNLQALSAQQIEAADVNGDKKVTLQDAQLILKVALNLMNGF